MRGISDSSIDSNQSPSKVITPATVSVNQCHTKINNNNLDNIQASVMHSQTNQHCQVYLSTAIIKIQTNSGKWITCRALLDSGSQISLLTKDLANKLQLPINSQTKYIINGVGNSPTHSSQTTTVNIASLNSNFSQDLTCVITEQISTNLPQYYVPLHNFKLPQDCILADPLFNVPKPIDLLIGGQLFYSLLQQGSIKLGNNKPTLVNTVFGWVVTGDIQLAMTSMFNEAVHSAHLVSKLTNSCETNSDTNTQLVFTSHISTEQSCDQLLKRFWEQEEVKPSPIYTTEHIYCENLYNTTTTRDPSGRFTVNLPIIEDKIDQLGDSYSIAQKCFMFLEKKFLNNPVLHKQYSDFINEYINLGHASYIPTPSKTDELEQKSKTFYLPHHPVLKPSSVSTKLRVVFNGSSQSSTAVSLNQVLHEGPNIYTDIIDIIMRLRTYKFVLSCDIVKMFRNINVNKKHCNLQCILWRPNPDDELRVIRLTTVSYETRCAPYLAFRTLLELAKQDGHLYPLASQCIQYQTFMDDVQNAIV